MTPSERVEAAFGGGVALVSCGFGFSGIGIFGYQCLTWLQTGEWIPVPVATAWTYFEWSRPTSTWVGVQKTIDWGLGQSLSIALVVAGILIFWIGLRLIEEGHQQQR